MTLEKQKLLQKRLIKLVQEKKSGHQIADLLGVNYTTVHRWLRKLGINLPNFHNALKFDNTVFDVIDTEEKAYWLGFLYADGYVSKDRSSVELSLAGNDLEHLEKFRQFLGYTNPIRTGVSTCNGKFYQRCRLHLVDAHFHNRLCDLGCIPNKSLILTFPGESTFSSVNLITHFIRGYVDGDGCISNTKTNALQIQIIGTKEMLDGIKKWCPEYFATTLHKDKRHPTSNTFVISCSGKKATGFGHLIYDNASVFLQRKYDKFNALKSND